MVKTPDVEQCSFCKKSQNDVRKLIAGPDVSICEECVQVCMDIIEDDCRVEARERRAETLSSPSKSPRVELATMAALMNHVAELSSSDQWFLVMHLLARLRSRDAHFASTSRT